MRMQSAGWRESGALWIGSLDGECAHVADVVFYHDLGDDKGKPLSLELSEDAKLSLYGNLAERGVKLLAMLHTHPEGWVGLSSIDQANQLCSRIGFWSLVLPWYGAGSWSLKRTGVHVRTNDGWYQFSSAQAKERILIR
jgi:hypothetical protein